MDKDETQSLASDSPDLWFLKLDDESVFGPTPVAELRHWAEQGRIAPGNMISMNQEEWIPAEDLDALHITWKVVFGDPQEEFGPINIKALAELLTDGTIPQDAQLVHKDTGETFSLAEKQADIFGDMPAISPEAHQELLNRLTELDAQITTTQQELTTARAQAAQEQAQLQAALDQTQTEHEATLQRIAALEQEKTALEQQLALTEKNLQEQAAGETDTLRRQILALEQELAAAQFRLETSETEAVRQQENRQSLEAEARETEVRLTGEIHNLREETQRIATLLENALRALETANTQHQQEMEQQVQSLRETEVALRQAQE